MYKNDTLLQPLESFKKEDSTILKRTNIYIDCLNILEGYKTKFKNLHWSIKNDALHIRLDQMLDEIIEFQDGIAESSSGIFGRMLPNDIRPILLTNEDPWDTLKCLKEYIISMLNTLPSSTEHRGIVSEFEVFLKTIDKYILLFDNCKC